METTQYWTDDKDGYLERNRHLDPAGLVDFFAEGLRSVDADEIDTICEYGCNVGLNLRALKELFGGADICGYDINPEAVNIANKILGVDAALDSLLTPKIDKYDLVLTKGLLIHIHPNDIQIAYDNLYTMTGKYLLICEYYNPTPVEVEYHGKSDLLFKRDFAGDMLDKYPDLKLVDYGFRYSRDEYPQDDITWFLLKKEK